MFHSQTQKALDSGVNLTFSSALIFGAAHGIGKAIEEHLRGNGSNFIVAVDRDPSYENCNIEDPLRGFYRLKADIVDPCQLRSAIEGIGEKSLELVVFSAGIQDDSQPERTRQINVEGTRNCFEAVLPFLKPGALAVFLSSDRVTFEGEQLSPYVSSKREIAEYAMSIAKAKDDLRVLILLPGPVDTKLFRSGKSLDAIRRIEEGPGILSVSEFSRMLFEDVIPQSLSHPSGASVRMYKRSGVEWLEQLDA